jgi:hypothetical protein
VRATGHRGFPRPTAPGLRNTSPFQSVVEGEEGLGTEEDSMKREIWATVTFLVTGLLFYLAQTSPPSAPVLPEGDAAWEDTVMVEEQIRRGA